MNKIIPWPKRQHLEYFTQEWDW